MHQKIDGETISECAALYTELIDAYTKAKQMVLLEITDKAKP